MGSSKGKHVPTPGTYLAPTVSSVARRVQYVELECAVQQESCHVQEVVRIATRSFTFLFRSLRHSSGCPDALGDCCLDNNCCPAGYVSMCTLLTNLAYFSFGVPQVCALANSGTFGCCPLGQTCSGTLSGE